MLGQLSIVLDRLADPEVSEPVCTTTAQELVYRDLIDTAIGCLPEGVDPQPLLDYYEQSVYDTDIELLFDPALDGVEEPTIHHRVSPPDNLEFARWFDRFRGDWPDPEPGVQDAT